MREEDGRFREFSTSRPGADGQISQDGFKEKLLCLECEGRFQKWEEYFARVVNQKQLFDLSRPTDGRKWVRLPGFDYAKTKLSLLSILWRTHVSKHPRFQVELGEKHELRLRQMLLTSEPGPAEEYGCQIAVPYIELGDSAEDQIMRPPVTVTPESVRWEHGLRIVRMQIDGLLFQFVVGALDVTRRTDARHLFLQQDGTLVVGVEDLTKIWYLRNAWGRTLGFI